ncbi:hypothetical protein PPERSA_09341 [Pseudocohnilembus persalinus]|uniref:EF-hand domain-containing protein n=1 Tax=Pseudocohnilembus persalinus TaxID=266149 RepID=A0A0V0QXW1_PSEPJ|nr:hypothetical protein PPERSA_09341 [Pseudocohnilembus persalinus]|eukprot:KRX07127.1 hypothetical protein PPERSA_09341 [Pseudocohnilembus persalinus]
MQNINNAPKFSYKPATKPPQPTKKYVPSKPMDEQELDDIQNLLKQSRQKQQDITSRLLNEDDEFLKQKIDKVRSTLEFIFQQNQEINPSKTYFDDGDPRMYTKENIEKRQKLKEDLDIQDALNSFMLLYKFDKYGEIDKREYMKVQVGLAKLLRPDLIKPEKKEQLVNLLEQDWKFDSNGKKKLNKQDMKNAIFQMTDVWTPDLDAQQYAEFLYMIKEKVRFDLKSIFNDDEDDNIEDINELNTQIQI